ncbi:MAG: exodeoxyribonuclease III [Actinomycetaceae bacterium]|nr:exodeoxyribonuclease III [Arcanobacterium sp.]MDD7504555.1 exodeoxyribonuclease III [Actinomycetaceae bacterium]MDY6143198.1 exodeoxyribonuclease III [Arcanobacterium sp.]
MKLATWNINSIRAAGRVDRALSVLERHDLDVLALQEIKCKPEQFPTQPFEDAGYHVVTHGLNQWNGVAVISRLPITHTATSFPGQPGFEKGTPSGGEGFIDGALEARALGTTLALPTGDTNAPRELTVWSLYVPNGRSLGDPHYHYKLAFLDALRKYAARELATNRDAAFILVGDWNVIPTDDDVWDVNGTDGLYLSAPERQAFFSVEDAGMHEVTRQYATNYTFWDYQKLRFPKNEGMRIDFAYASPAVADLVTGAAIDRNERKGKGASDHVPVIVELR